MTRTTTELQDAKAWLATEPQQEPWRLSALARHLEAFVAIFSRTSTDQHQSMIREFHNGAGRLPYFQDTDIGALILEAAADASEDSALRRFLYTEALFRARWCASGATAGAEGHARSVHVRRLDEKSRYAA